MVKPPYELTGIILVGGDSRRMGRPKSALDLGGRTLVNRVVERLAPLCLEVLLVAKRPLDFLDSDLRIVRDLEVGQGPLGGLSTGLFYARTAWTLVAACDLPFLQPRLLNLLAEKALGAPPGPRAFVPRTTGGWHPLLAVYSKACLAPIQACLTRGIRKVDDLRFHGLKWIALEEAELKASDPELVSFVNVNTPEELAAARFRLEHGCNQDFRPNDSLLPRCG
ncbi:MAG: molybdenum cofactor guanylyltransferase [Thermodesulfobacteriota bacterium]